MSFRVLLRSRLGVGVLHDVEPVVFVFFQRKTMSRTLL